MVGNSFCTKLTREKENVYSSLLPEYKLASARLIRLFAPCLQHQHHLSKRLHIQTQICLLLSWLPKRRPSSTAKHSLFFSTLSNKLLASCTTTIATPSDLEVRVSCDLRVLLIICPLYFMASNEKRCKSSIGAE